MKSLKIVVLTFTVFVLAGCGGVNYTKLETELEDKALAYYEENIKLVKLKSEEVMATYQTVSLENLELSGIDVTSFKEAKCDMTSYATLKTTNNEVTETDVNLTCGDYKTKKEK
jgi:outer membrane lipopolysaccharide assembly protein LptE/RlpB